MGLCVISQHTAIRRRRRRRRRRLNTQRFVSRTAVLRRRRRRRDSSKKEIMLLKTRAFLEIHARIFSLFRGYSHNRRFRFACRPEPTFFSSSLMSALDVIS